MRRSTLHRLPAKLATLLAIVAMGVVQPMLSACTCGIAAASKRAESVESAEIDSPALPPCCCSSLCEEPAAASCCDAGGCGSDNCDDCACSVSSTEYPLPSPSNGAPTDDAPAQVVYIPAAALAANIGLHGAAWHNAFDLASLGGSLGIRLHALLSVWRI